MRLFNGCHSSTHQTLKHKADSSDVIISSGSAGNREISSYRTGIEATHTSEFAAQHSLSPPAPYTSALAALYSNPTTPALTPMRHSATSALRDCSAAMFKHPHNTAAHPERWKAKTEATFRVEFRDDCKNTDAAYGFSTYSPHPVLYHEKMYPTSEHLLQALQVRAPEPLFSCPLMLIYYRKQFERNAPDLAEHIRTCSDDPEMAVAESGRHHKFRCFPKVDAVSSVAIMYNVPEQC